MDDFDRMDDFDDQVAQLGDNLFGAQTYAAVFSQELQKVKASLADASNDVGKLSSGIGRGLRGAFDGLLFDGMKLSDALTQVGRSMANAAYSSAITPISKQLGGALGGGLESLISQALPFANGGAFSQGRVTPFAKGGVVSSPTTFPMRGGTGLMGEAGPEAIMPLARGPDGKLGVRSESGQKSINIVMNISTPDAASFQRSQSQIASQVTRALGRSNRNR